MDELIEQLQPSDGTKAFEYAGFWVRTGATLIDSMLMMLITTPLLYSIYGDQYFNPDKLIVGFWDGLISWILPALAVIAFWAYRGATPGKMVFSLYIIDAESGGIPSVRQLVIRYLGYFVSSIPLCGGFLWVAYDRRKQGWHDKMAKTVVIRDR